MRNRSLRELKKGLNESASTIQDVHELLDELIATTPPQHIQKIPQKNANITQMAPETPIQPSVTQFDPMKHGKMQTQNISFLRNLRTTSGVLLLAGAKSDHYNSILDEMDEANWSQFGGKIPSIPSWPYQVPSICPRSMTTSLQRIFYSGINVLKEVKKLSKTSNKKAKQYMKQVFTDWKKRFFSRLFQVYGTRSEKNQKQIKNIQNLLQYVFFNLEPKEFLEAFEKIAYNAYMDFNPARA